ncbi:nucleotidyl transferase AbiEii/AbiGii toxin family protein [Polynucleobacter asymbioticus]|uniref:nucleotidyl transferase AbiEii/AbiGii toxin family protein n=1 Tax=Polynucleobacter asymbioticus TaxID=576611 RepID=UPI0008F8494A|nr:nucleotidyl transferase AbiEii/AbiGii toxin family protein [Polynucleobacter asymbioticus]
MADKNIGASVRAKLKNKAQAEGKEFNLILTRYALERLLYRLSISDYREHFLLKGALLFDLWFDVPLRATRDIDLLGFQLPDAAYLIKAFEDLCALEVADGIEFEGGSIRAEEIRKEANYTGMRVTLVAYLDGARSAIQVDVGYGDAVTPAPEMANYPVLLSEFPSPRLRVYPRYTVVAEKLDAIISLGMANSRMKDYFDLWVILNQSGLDQEILRTAVEATTTRRKTLMPEGLPLGLSDEFSQDRNKNIQWNAFLTKNQLDKIELRDLVLDLQGRLSYLFRVG